MIYPNQLGGTSAISDSARDPTQSKTLKRKRRTLILNVQLPGLEGGEFILMFLFLSREQEKREDCQSQAM